MFQQSMWWRQYTVYNLFYSWLIPPLFSLSQVLMILAVSPRSLLHTSLVHKTLTCPCTRACSTCRALNPTTRPHLLLQAQRVICRRLNFTAARWDPRGLRRATRSRRRVRGEPCLTHLWDTSTQVTHSSCSHAQLMYQSTQWRRWVRDMKRDIFLKFSQLWHHAAAKQTTKCT